MNRASLALALPILALSLMAHSAGHDAGAGDMDRMVEDVLSLWDEADVVALGESHGSRLDSDFRLALVRHPDFARQVDVILIEFANQNRQDVLDRYIAGEDVPRSEFVRIWRDTGAEPWDSPIYEEFLSAVREVNARGTGSEVRVLAGDPPVDWDNISSGAELIRFSDRGDFPTHIVDCQVLANGLKALIVFGTLHLIHGPGDSFVSALDVAYPGRVKTLVGTGVGWKSETLDRIRAAVGVGADPQLIATANSPISEWDFDETIGMRPRDYVLPMGDAIDGLLYFGTLEDEVVSFDRSIYEEPDYKAQRERRRALRDEFSAHIRANGFAGQHEYGDYECEAN